MMGPEDYRDRLREIARTKQKNSRVSLRALARQAELAPSFLHALLAKKSHITYARLQTVTSRLKISRYEKNHLLLLHHWTLTENQKKKNELARKIEANSVAASAKYLCAPEESLLLTWEAMLIHEYLFRNRPTEAELEDFTGKMGISNENCRISLGALERNGLVSRDLDGRLERIHARLLAECLGNHESSLPFHRQVVARAVAALESRAPPERYSVGEFVWIPKAKLAQLASVTNQFYDTLQSLSESGATDLDESEIYMVMTHAFPVRVDGVK